VYKGVNVLTDQKVIIKILKPGKIILNSVKLKKILRETRILQALKGGTNIVQLLEVIKDPSSKTPSLILEYNVNNDHKTLYKTFNDFDIRFYIYELLKVINLLKRL
jgi:casein kinase II subunit alpha